MQQPTIRLIAEQTNTKPDTLRKRLQRAGMSAGLDDVLSDAQLDVLFAAGSVSARTRKHDRNAQVRTREQKRKVEHATVDIERMQVVADKSEAKEYFAFGLSMLADAMLVCIIAGHGLLIVQELTELAGAIGRTSGIIVAMTILATIVLSTDSRWFDVSGALMWFVFLLDVAAIYLHYRAFSPHVGAGLALGLAVVVSATAFFSLYAFRSKNSNLFE